MGGSAAARTCSHGARTAGRTAGGVVLKAAAHRRYDLMLETADIYFSTVFTIEAVLKLLALGWDVYWRDPWNKFDFVVVVVGHIGYAVKAGKMTARGGGRRQGAGVSS